MNVFAKAFGIELPNDKPTLISFADFSSYEEYIQFLEDEKRMKESEEFMKGVNNG